MKKSVIFAITLAVAICLSFAGTALAAKKVKVDAMPAPWDFACEDDGSGFMTSWMDLEETQAMSYSVEFECSTEVEIEEVITTIIVEFNIGTHDPEDDSSQHWTGSPMYISYDGLNFAAGTDLDGYDCVAKVKGLDSWMTKGKSQDGLWSNEDKCD